MTYYPTKDAKAALDALGRLKDSSSLPLAANVLITPNADGALWSRWASEARLEIAMTCDSPPSTAHTIPCDTLREIVALASGDDLRVEPETSGSVTVAHEGGTYELMTLPAEDYPAGREHGDIAGGFALSSDAFAHALKRVLWAAPAKEARRILVGVHVEAFSDGVRLTATDGKQMARVCAETAACEPFPAFVLPLPVAQLLASMLAGVEGEASVTVHENGGLVVECGGSRLSCQKVEGEYPQVDRVIPKGKPAATIRGSHEALTRALKRANVTADNVNHVAVLTIANGALSIESSEADVGRAKIRAHEVEVEGAATFGVHALMMARALAEAEPSEVRIHDAQRPIVLAGDTVEAVVMPIKLAELQAARGGEQ